MRRRTIRIAATSIFAAALLTLTAGPAVASEQKTFVGFGPLPSDAHAAAVAQMHAYSAGCVEISTTYSGAGSAHTWKATLTALC